MISRRTLLSGGLIATTRLLAGCGGSTTSGDAAVSTGTERPLAAPPTQQPNAPAWATQAQSGTWIEVPVATTLEALNPANNPTINPNYPRAPEWHGSGGQHTIVDAWCGAAFDETNDQMFLGIGGGHSDYGGNEVYRCDFFNDRPSWKMLRPPSGAVGNQLITRDSQEHSGKYRDGRPRAVHGYNKWLSVPGVGPVLAAHGGTYYTAAKGQDWALFIDPNSGEAAYTKTLANTVSNSFEPYFSQVGACYDPSRNAIWIFRQATSGVYRYDIPSVGAPHTGTYTLAAASSTFWGYLSACYIPGHDCVLLCRSGEDLSVNEILVFDCTTGTIHTPGVTGTAVAGFGSGQPRWVPGLGAACVWNNASNTTLINTLTPGANPRTSWTIGTLPVSPGNTTTPSARALNQTFGRFAYSPRLGGFLLFNSSAGPTYFYRL